jgi:pteridine reductase
MLQDLSEQVALVTGSAHRVGKAIAMELARSGVNIMIHYHTTDEAVVRDTVQDMKSLGVDAFSVQADVSTPEGVQIAFDAVKENFGKLNILVNSASTFTRNHLMDVTLADWEKSLKVNATAPFLCTQAAVRLMRENDPPGGAIINILDYGAVRPWAERADHNVSKAALAMLTEVSALDLGKEKVRVNGVLPGPVLRDDGATEERWEEIGQSLPLGYTGEPEDVARAVVYLASETFVTGTILKVNGGETL